MSTNARSHTHRHCTRPRWMPGHAAHAASEAEYPIAETGDYDWDDAPVTTGELLREFIGGIMLIGGGILIAWVIMS